VLVLERAGHT